MNPYVKILNTMKSKGVESNAPGISIGTIVSPLPNLIVKTKDLQLYKDDILISSSLLDYKQNIDINCVASGTISTGGQLQNINISKQEMSFEGVLKAGDLVAIMPTVDLQTWIVLCKVVSI